MNKSELKKQLAEVKELIKTKEKEIDSFEIDRDKHVEQYRDMIDEISGVVKIGNLEYTASRVLEEIDPTAYRCGLNDYVDGLEKEDDEDYKKLTEELEELESQLEDLENELEEIDE
jgi:DNA repair ATPase RecN